ncbi:DUF5718 family protein [Shewanella marina]|uniref:DUF5718 family protein n=1 Tax=Shewanella marina TaxID=487319 RepID=UPI000471485B|nr:DUF5718 family protein [Shewanella marina]
MKCFSLGIIGNFAGHLSAAEKITESLLPSGIFIVNGLNNHAISSGIELQYPPFGANIQAEPEFVVKFNVRYQQGKVCQFIPTAITVGNDMTIRKLDGANKIDQRKAWGNESKGIASHWWPVDNLAQFDQRYKLVSILKRNNAYIDYTPIADPSELKVFYQWLCEWLVDTVNNQQSEGICQQILPQIAAAGYPDEIVVFCGAPNYTAWGQTHFIEPADEVIIALINSDNVLIDNVLEKLKVGDLVNDNNVISYSQVINYKIQAIA